MVMLIPVAVRSKAYVCACSFAGIADSNTAADLYIRLLCLWCVVCLCLWCVVCVAPSATCCSFVQRSLTVCVCVCVPNFV